MNGDILYSIIKRICEIKTPGKKSLQKIIYLIQQKGVDLGYSYCIHHYGPYSSVLDYSLQSLERQGYIDVKRSGMTSLITPTNFCDSYDIEIQYQKFIPEKRKVIDDVISEYSSKTARELELLTTTDYVARYIMPSTLKEFNEIGIINEFKKIKGEKFSDEDIYDALKKLKTDEYLLVNN